MTSESRAWERPDGTLYVPVTTSVVWQDGGPLPSDATPLVAAPKVDGDDPRVDLLARATARLWFEGGQDGWTGSDYRAWARDTLGAIDSAAPVAREDTASPDEAARTAPCPDCGAVVGVLDSIPSLAPVIDDHKWLGVLCSGSGTALDRPAPAQPTEAPDVQRAAEDDGDEACMCGTDFTCLARHNTRGILAAQLDEALFYTAPDGTVVFRWMDGRVSKADEPLLDGLPFRMADVALGVLRGGGADGDAEDEDVAMARRDPTGAVARVRAKVMDAHALVFAPEDDEVPSFRDDLADAVMAIVGPMMANTARMTMVDARAQARLSDRCTAHEASIARLARAAGVSPDSEDPVGAIEAAIRAGRQGHEELFAAEADYWQKRHRALAERVGAAVKALSGGGPHYLREPDTETRPEPPVGTTFTNPETGAIAWQRQDDGWHCTRADCWNCPAAWDEVCDWGGGVDGLVRHLPVVRVGTGGGES